MVKIIDYSEKAIAVAGDTREFLNAFKALGGRFNPRLSCGAGWVFPKTRREQVQAVINGENLPSAGANEPRRADTTHDDARALLGEYREEISKVWPRDGKMVDYNCKHVSSLVRLSNGGLLAFEKPRIETSFCFGYSLSAYNTDDYDDANRACERATENGAYFLERNLAEFDDKIKALNDADGLRVATIYPLSYGDKEINVYNWRTVWHCDFESRPQFIEKHETRMSDADKKIILAGLQAEREKFKTRLQAYLKRYGTSKLKTWTYWRDE